MCDFENSPRISYGDDGATFIPRCEQCLRFVKAPRTVLVSDAGLSKKPNARCSKCGPTHMIFEGFV